MTRFGLTIIVVLAIANLLLALVLVATSQSASEPTSYLGAGEHPALTGAPQRASTGGVPLPAATNVVASEGNVPTTSTPGLSIRGLATWYCGGGSPCTRGYGPSDLIAAIDPTTGIEKGERITVWHGEASVVVTIRDVCACPGARIIDLTYGAFSRLADPSLGVIPVVPAPARGQQDARPRPTLPATDTEGEHP